MKTVVVRLRDDATSEENREAMREAYEELGIEGGIIQLPPGRFSMGLIIPPNQSGSGVVIRGHDTVFENSEARGIESEQQYYEHIGLGSPDMGGYRCSVCERNYLTTEEVERCKHRPPPAWWDEDAR